MSEGAVFALWVALYPLAAACCNLIAVKVRLACGIKPYTLRDIQGAAFFQFAVWVWA